MKDIAEFSGEYYFLSNFYNAQIAFDGITYKNNEAAFQAQKTLINREEFANLEPNIAKSRGRKVNLRSDWELVKDDLMYQIVLAKFTQNYDLKVKLINTGKSKLIEGNNWNDKYWGKCNGSGLNKLGIILEMVRDKLK